MDPSRGEIVEIYEHFAELLTCGARGNEGDGKDGTLSLDNGQFHLHCWTQQAREEILLQPLGEK